MCKGSRDFIITQKWIKGFLNSLHDNFASLFYEIEESKNFDMKFRMRIHEVSIKKLATKLNKLNEKDQIQLLRNHHPAEFVASLNAMERYDELDELIGFDDEKIQTWAIFGNVIPDLQREAIDGKLHEVSGEEIGFSHWPEQLRCCKYAYYDG